jgi:hypothetical protein
VCCESERERVFALFCAAPAARFDEKPLARRIVRAESVIVIIILCLNNKYSREICERGAVVICSSSSLIRCKPAYLCLYNSIHPKISASALFVNNVVCGGSLS